MGPRHQRRRGLANRLYHWALWLFPARIRDIHRPEMEEMFADAWEQAKSRGLRSKAALLLRTALDLTFNGLAARIEGGIGMETWRTDLQQVVTRLLRRPAFTSVASLTMALGIGGTTAVYTIVDAAYLDPLPFPDGEELVVPYQSQDPTQGIGFAAFSGPLQAALAEEGPFDTLAAILPHAANVGGTDQPERVVAARVNAAFFPVAAVAPALGRAFAEDEDVPGGPPVAVIGHSLWSRRWAEDPGVVGRTVMVDGVPTTVVGVMPAGFELMLPDVELWLPQRLSAADFDETTAVNNNRVLIGRVSRDIPEAATTRALAAAVGAVRARFPEALGDAHGISLVPLRTHLYGSQRSNLLLLLGAVALVLLIASANLAGLLLVRAEERRTELALRAALGAGGGRLVRSLVTESVVLSLIGGAIGAFLASPILYLVRPFAPPSVPFPAPGEVDGSVVGVTLIVALLTGVVFGFVPALGALRTNLRPVLAEEGRGGSSRGRARARGVLVVVEIALTVVLLVGCGLVLNSLWRLQALDPGFETESRIAADIVLPRRGYPDATSLNLFYRELVESLEVAPDVAAAGLGQFLPLTSASNWGFEVEGQEGLGFADYNLVTPGYLDAMGMHVVSGRPFTWENAAPAARPEVMVSEAMARRLWPGEDPLGQRINVDLGPRVWREVVGVVSDIRNRSLAQPPADLIYFPPIELPMSSPRGMTLVVHHPGAPTPAERLRSVVRRLDPGVPLTTARTLDSIAFASERGRVFMLILLGTFAGLAVVLAGVGLYSVVAYAFSMRTREIGVRMALGAGRQRVLRLVAGQSGVLVALGLGAGLVGAASLARFLRSLLYEVEALDPATYVGAAAFVLAVSVVASWVPAVRATAVDPASVLRD